MAAAHVKVACQAMATRFEILLYGRDKKFLRAAGEEAIREIERLERKLSAFRPDSSICRINREATVSPVPVDPELFRLLNDCAAYSRDTAGAFDITLSPLFEAWGMREGSGRRPTDDELDWLRQTTGMDKLQLDPANRTVRFKAEGMRLDLGAVGKGFALDTAAECLRETGVTTALIHGGTSSAIAIGHPPEDTAWRVAIRLPSLGDQKAPPHTPVNLNDDALSVSAPSGREFRVGQETHGHLFSLETSGPVGNISLAAVICRSAARADALATGLAAGGEKLFQAWETRLPDLPALLVLPGKENHGQRVLSRRIGNS